MRVLLVLAFLCLVGCALTPEQMDALSQSLGSAAQTGAQIAAPRLGLDGATGAGLAGAIGTAVTVGIGLLLRWLRKK